MSNVIKFERNSPKYRTGSAVCRGCHHEWEAETESDCLSMECPECNTMKGTFKWPYAAAEGQFAFVCGCGCEDFFIMAKTKASDAGVYCRNCGDEKEEWWSK